MVETTPPCRFMLSIPSVTLSLMDVVGLVPSLFIADPILFLSFSLGSVAAAI